MKFPVFLAAFVAATSALADQPVKINFAAELGGQPFSCAKTYEGLGASGAPVQVLDYRLFVSEPALIKADGTQVPITLDQDRIWQTENIALLDFEDATGSCTNGTPAQNAAIRGTAPKGDYVGLTFMIGVPFDWNHGDPTVAPSPLNLTAMFWNWRGGYKFIKFETSPVAEDGINMAVKDHAEGAAADGKASGWFLHLGSTMCKSSSRTEAPQAPCRHPNTMRIKLDGFDPATGTVVIDPARVIAKADLTKNTPETSPGCMSFTDDPDCNTVLPRLGLTFNEHAASDQVLISAR